MQLNVNAQLDILSSVLKDQIVRQNQQDTTALDEALKTLNAIKSRVTVLSNVLQSAQNRLILMNDRVAAIQQARALTEQQ